MDLEWSKTTEERACVKDAPEGSAIVSAGEGTIRVEADGEEGTSKKAAGHLLSIHRPVRAQDVLSKGVHRLLITDGARIQGTAGDLIRIR